MAPRIVLQLMQMMLALVQALMASRMELALENLALRQQVATLKRERPRPLITDLDRLFWVALRERWSDWANALIIVKPETVVHWHQAAFKRHWARLSGSGNAPGRPPVSKETRGLIRKMATDNPTWGAPRIHAELLKLGIDLGEATVSRYLPKRPPEPDRVERWKAFLRNHMPDIAAMDFVTIPTASFKVLYCLFFIHHDRRRILHFNVTSNPTAAWVVQQLREVFFDEPRIRYLVHDRDGKFAGVTQWLKSAGADGKTGGRAAPNPLHFGPFRQFPRRQSVVAAVNPPIRHRIGPGLPLLPGLFGRLQPLSPSWERKDVASAGKNHSDLSAEHTARRAPSTVATIIGILVSIAPVLPIRAAGRVLDPPSGSC